MPFPTSEFVRQGHFSGVVEIGQGAQTIVYRADYPRIGTVAVKASPPGVPDAAAASMRLNKEWQVLQRLKHPNIVAAHRLLTDPQTREHYLLCEFVGGGSLAEYLDQRGPDQPLDQSEVLGYGLDICAALEELEREQIVHRDLKPSNILIHEERPGQRVARLADFGVAQDQQGQMTTVRTGIYFTGTPIYMAPEQSNPTIPLDSRADCYALAITLWELLTCRRDYKQLARAGKAQLRRYNRKANPHLDAVFAKATQEQPDHRYRTVAAFAADLRAVRMGKAPAAARQIFNRKAGQGLAAMSGLAALALLVFAFLFTTGGSLAVGNAAAAQTQTAAVLVGTSLSIAAEQTSIAQSKTALANDATATSVAVVASMTAESERIGAEYAAQTATASAVHADETATASAVHADETATAIANQTATAVALTDQQAAAARQAAQLALDAANSARQSPSTASADAADSAAHAARQAAAAARAAAANEAADAADAAANEASNAATEARRAVADYEAAYGQADSAARAAAQQAREAANVVQNSPSIANAETAEQAAQAARDAASQAQAVGASEAANLAMQSADQATQAAQAARQTVENQRIEQERREREERERREREERERREREERERREREERERREAEERARATRLVMLDGELYIEDDETFGSNERGRFRIYHEVVVTPDQSVAQVQDIQCVGGEVRVEVYYNIRLQPDHRTVVVDGVARLFEGKSCDTDKLRKEVGFSKAISENGAEPIVFRVSASAGDYSDIGFNATNQQR